MLILVNYPDLLEIAHLSEYIRKIELKKIYDRDIENNSNLFFQHKKVFPIKEDGDIENKTKFHHLITEELYEKDDNGKKISSHREFDIHRSMRLHWVRPHLEERITDEILVFSLDEWDKKKRMTVFRTYIYNVAKKYIVVLEPQQRSGRSYYLLTAYYLNRNYAEKEMKKKLRNKLPEVL